MILWDLSASPQGYDILIGLPVFLPSPPMGWEVFYQATLIPTPICSTELMPKKEGNCNVMIPGPADHELQVIFLATAMSSSSCRLIVTMTSSALYRLGHKWALAFFGAEVLRVVCEPKQFALIVGSRRLLTDRQCLFGHGQAWLLRCRHQFLSGRLGGRVTLQCPAVTIQG